MCRAIRGRISGAQGLFETPFARSRLCSRNYKPYWLANVDLGKREVYGKWSATPLSYIGAHTVEIHFDNPV